MAKAFVIVALLNAATFSRLTSCLVLPAANGIEKVLEDVANIEHMANAASDFSSYPVFDVTLVARQVPSTSAVSTTSTPAVPTPSTTPGVSATPSTAPVPSTSVSAPASGNVSVPVTTSTPGVPTSTPATSTASATPSTTASFGKSSSASAGAIAGGVVGGIAGAAVILAVLVWWKWSSIKGAMAGKRSEPENETETEHTDSPTPAEEKDFSMGRYDAYQDGKQPSTSLSGTSRPSKKF